MITRALQIRGSNRMGQPGVTKDSNGSAANALLKGAIMMAPEAVGNPSNRGKGESAGYFKWLAIREPRTFSMLFLRILPLQIGRLTDPTARALVQAIMMAPEAVGDPSNRGKGGAAGYFKWLATREPRTFSMLLLQRGTSLMRTCTKSCSRESIGYCRTRRGLAANPVRIEVTSTPLCRKPA
jgi:hypothetical protein